jgi:hypothetical protein
MDNTTLKNDEQQVLAKSGHQRAIQTLANIWYTRHRTKTKSPTQKTKQTSNTDTTKTG